MNTASSQTLTEIGYFGGTAIFLFGAVLFVGVIQLLTKDKHKAERKALFFRFTKAGRRAHKDAKRRKMEERQMAAYSDLSTMLIKTHRQPERIVRTPLDQLMYDQRRYDLGLSHRDDVTAVLPRPRFDDDTNIMHKIDVHPNQTQIIFPGWVSADAIGPR